MGYPDNVLAGDEQVVLHRHPHWKRLIGPVLILLLATALASFGAAYVNTMDWASNAKTIVSLVILAVWAVVVGWLTVWPFLTWLSRFTPCCTTKCSTPWTATRRRADVAQEDLDTLLTSVGSLS